MGIGRQLVNLIAEHLPKARRVELLIVDQIPIPPAIIGAFQHQVHALLAGGQRLLAARARIEHRIELAGNIADFCGALDWRARVAIAVGDETRHAPHRGNGCGDFFAQIDREKKHQCDDERTHRGIPDRRCFGIGKHRG